jgi:hypothetical protein
MAEEEQTGPAMPVLKARVLFSLQLPRLVRNGTGFNKGVFASRLSPNTFLLLAAPSALYLVWWPAFFIVFIEKNEDFFICSL